MCGRRGNNKDWTANWTATYLTLLGPVIQLTANSNNPSYKWVPNGIKSNVYFVISDEVNEQGLLKEQKRVLPDVCLA